MNRLLLAALLALALLALALLAPTALAQTCTTSWTNPTGGPWETAANWSDDVPEASDTACITLAGTYTVTTTSSDRSVAGLVVGGASGTQTLTVLNRFTVAGNGLVRPSGRLELLDRTPGGSDGLLTTGTVTVQGVFVQNGGTTLLDGGGTLDVAPGGRWEMQGGASAGVESRPGTYRLRGTLDASYTSTQTVNLPLDVQGGTVRVSAGRLDVRGGVLANATVDAAAGTELLLMGTAGFVLSGTLSGTPVGAVYASGGAFAAAPGGATLAVGGTGLQLSGSALLTSAGGTFLNTGLLVHPLTGSNFASIEATTLRNEGRFLIDRSGFGFRAGGVVRNEPGGVIELFGGSAGIGGVGGREGRFDNAGLVLRTGPDGTSGFSGLLRSLPGSELRVLTGRLDLAAPGSRSVPDGTTLTGTGRFLLPRDLEIEGAVSPGTPEQPLARLSSLSAYRPSLVSGSPRLVIDVDAGGRSDTLAVEFSSGSGNTRLGGAIVVRLRPGFTPAIGDQWTVLTSESPDGITGQFSQVVAEGAPSGVAFVAEENTAGNALIVRAVATAPGGPITVSTTTPVGGGVRPLFLTGPGAPGITAARLECTACLDADSLGVIPAQVVGTGTLREARFDLTSPRAFGLYDLVVERPGQPNEVVPVTVRPFVSYIQVLPTVVRGMRVRPPTGPGGGGYNWSHYNLWNVSNVEAPAYTFAAAGRQDSSLVAFAVASGTPFSSGVLFYESETAPDPEADALLYARLAPRTPVPLSIGQRIAPEDVRFPEQPSSGPDDPRIPFGADRLVTVFAGQHMTFERARFLVEGALRTTGHAPLDAYLAQVNAADASAISASVEAALQSESRYVGGIPAMLTRLLSEMNSTVATPGGLAAGANTAFDGAIDRYAGWHYRDVEQAYRIDLAEAPAAVRALLQAEYDALAEPAALGLLGRGTTIGGACRRALASAASSSSASNNRLSRAIALGAAACVAQSVIQNQGPHGPPPPPPTSPNPSPNEAKFRAAAAAAAQSAAAAAGGQRGGESCGGGAGGGTGGGAGAGGACGPPEAPADPNDKTTDATTLCEIGTVTVDGQLVTRCVRYFVPLAEATEPIPYTIQFENLPQATANAEFVTVTDTLDADLDPATLEVLATSSDSTFSYSVAGQVVTFRFVGIDLPPNVTSPEGQGYITYLVRPRAGLPTGTVIENEASIVFDFNPPISTPMVVHEIRQTADVSTTVLAPDFVVEGQPITFAAVVANLSGDFATDATVTLTAGGLAMTAAPSTGTCTGTTTVTCAFGALEAGTFARVELTVASPPLGRYTVRSAATTSAFDGFTPNNVEEVSVGVATVGAEAPSGLPAELTLSAPWPNPSRGDVTFRVGIPAAGLVDVRVYDLLGREVARLAEGEPGEAGWHETVWNARSLASGVYVVRLSVGDETRTRRITVLR
ncbi:MAG TPA: T9SS type A sorting domain-containing protein [Rubricoccaceae bacterium]